MTLSTSSTWPRAPHRSPRLGPMHPKPALRSIQWMGGLFDISVPGDDLLLVAPEKPEVKAESCVPSLSEMLAMLEADTLLPSAMSEAGSALSPPPAPTSPPAGAPSDELLLGDGSTAFLEGFTNLSDYLFTGTDVAMDVVTEPIQDVVSSTEGVRKLKRTATMAALDISLASGCSSTSSQNPDHNDYVAKKKPRRSGPAGKAEAVTKKPAAGAKDEKYRERRIKNNIASKRSRETRKMKYTAMEQKAIDLEASNQELEERVEELEALTKRMKEVLVKRLSQSTSIATG